MQGGLIWFENGEGERDLEVGEERRYVICDTMTQ